MNFPFIILLWPTYFCTAVATGNPTRTYRHIYFFHAFSPVIYDSATTLQGTYLGGSVVYTQFLCFVRHASKADCGVCDINPLQNSIPLKISSLPVYTRAQRESWAISLTSTTATVAVKKAYTGSAIAGTYVPWRRCTARGRGTSDFSNYSKTQVTLTTDKTISLLG